MRTVKKLTHDKYGKDLLRRILGNRFITGGPEVEVPYEGVTAQIDGVVRDCCAVEISASVDKQVRGALLDLHFHPCDKKLLVLVYGSMNNPERTAKHCEDILERLGSSETRRRVVLLAGAGDLPREEEDLKRLRLALKELGCL